MKNDKFFCDKFLVKETEYGTGKTFIIAELGTAHGGDVAKADELIAAAAESGADCLKFQMVYADEILHKNTGEVALPGGSIRLYDRFKKLQQPLSFFAHLKEKTEKAGLVFLCTPFGLKSAKEIFSLSPDCLKIASPELNYNALLREIASFKLPVFLSTGVSKLGDIEQALGALSPYDSTPNTPVCLLHCVTSYPAPETDYNLRVMGNLAAIFGVPVGVSDHSMDCELVPALAASVGAAAIEKHFCLSQDDDGLDDPIALPPDQFARMVKAVRTAEKNGAAKTISALEQERGVDFVQRVLGDGIKRLAASEAGNYGLTNRSVHALLDIQKGEIIQKEMIRCLRSEKNLRAGLPPEWEQRIIGRRALNFIPAGEGIRFQDI